MKTTKTLLLKEKIQESSELLRALTHPLRMQIMEYIDSQDCISVNKIYSTLNLEQSITSQHLRILRNAGVVETKRDGKFIYYSINYDKVAAAMKAIKAFTEKA